MSQKSVKKKVCLNADIDEVLQSLKFDKSSKAINEEDRVQLVEIFSQCGDQVIIVKIVDDQIPEDPLQTLITLSECLVQVFAGQACSVCRQLSRP